MSDSLLAITPAEPGQRRHFTPQQKRALLEEAQRPGQSMSGVARQYGVAPSLLFHWKRVMDDATKKGLKANEHTKCDGSGPFMYAHITDKRNSSETDRLKIPFNRPSLK